MAVDLSSLIGSFLGAVFRIWKHRNIEHEKRAHKATCQSTASHKNVETLFPKNPVVLVWQRVCASAEEFLRQGCHCQGKVMEKRKFFKVREKSGNFLKSQGRSVILSKSVKSQGIVFFRYIVHKFSSRPWNAFSFGKDEKWVCCKASKAINLTLYAWLM